MEDNSVFKRETKDQLNLILTVLFGWLGYYRYSEKEYGLGLLYMVSFGLFGIGWIYDIYLCYYYGSEKFFRSKEKVKDNTRECNELNRHIEELKESYADVKQIDYGNASYSDNSNWNFQRPARQKYQVAQNVCRCSRTVCSNAQNQPFKYVCKYFNIKPTEKNLEQFEKILNNFSAAEQGKVLLKNERDKIIKGIASEIPLMVNELDKKRLIRKLGFNEIDFSQLYFPRYIFSYTSSGGNSSMSSTVVLDLDNMERFINYLSEIVKFRKSAAGQRALMTAKLRERIKERDNYTCCNCQNSTSKEENLLLEIDHIVPIAKGGMTSEDNLQTLCWKCNRSKGAKLTE